MFPTWALAAMLGLQGMQQGYNMLRGNPAQPPAAPNLGQTLMSQGQPMTPAQAYPKQQPQAQDQNGSLLGNSLMYNPITRRRYGY